MDKTPTPEEIEAARRLVAEHDAKLGQERMEQQRAAVQPLLDIVNSDGFKEMEASIGKLFAVAADIEPIRVHVGALQAGLTGLRDQAAGLAAFMQAPAIMMPTPARWDVSEQPPLTYEGVE